MESREEQNSIATSSRVTLDDLAMESPEGESVDHGGLDLHRGHQEEDELEDTDDEGEHEAYERDRQRRIRENQQLLSSLGIAPSTPLTGTNSMTTPSQSTARRKEKKAKPHRRVYDRSGYIVSAPGPGERQRIACVEMPADRQLARRIQEGEYVDCEEWWVGEERRWRFGHGNGTLADGEAFEVGGVTPEFRWRKWRGLQRELRREMKQVTQSNKKDKAGVETPTAVKNGEVSAYSLIPGDPCHQCRRKSEKLKMRCRNVDPVCRAVFCETCCKRYSYFDFDPESRSFICPLCKDCCNCSNCIRKRKLDHLLGGKAGLKTKSIEGMTVQAWLEQGIKDKVNVPFERVRLVDQAFDVISPQLPPEEKPAPAKAKASKKRKTKTEKGTTQPKAKRAKKEKEGGTQPTAGGTAAPLVLKLKVPKPVREKEVDSDGDTVGVYSDDDAKSDGSSLTSLSGSEGELPVPPRFAFPPRPSFSNHPNEYLATISPTHPLVPLTLATMADRQGPHEMLAKSPVSPLTPGGSRPRPPSRESSVSSGETRRRKRPPPKANIVRIPKHALSAPSTALPTSASSQVEPTPMLPAMSFQSFSYDGYSSVPPPALPQYPTFPSGYHHGLPPPYSHSPQHRTAELPQHDVYGPIMPPATVYPVMPGNIVDAVMGSTADVQMVQPPHVNLGDGMMHGQAMWMQTRQMTELGLTMERRYHPDQP